MRCPQHGHGCRWYLNRGYGAPDITGSNLGYGAGFDNGRDFARCHEPMLLQDMPCSDGRRDDFALGFHTGVWAGWCADHPNDCRGHWSCQQKILAKAGLR